MKRVVSHGIYNMNFILALSIGIVVISLVSVRLYSQDIWIRYIILAIMFIVAFMFRKKIIGIWEEMKNR